MVLSTRQGVLSTEDVSEYIENYLGVIENPWEREKLTDKTRVRVDRNIREYGLPTSERLHLTLEKMLDSHLPGKRWSQRRNPTEEVLGLDKTIAQDIIMTESDMGECLKKGNDVITLLREKLSKREFLSIVQLLGNSHDLAYLIGNSEISRDTLDNDNLFYGFKCLMGLPIDSIVLLHEYMRFDGNYRKRNPIQRLDPTSMPVVKTIISKAYQPKMPSIRKTLIEQGFSGLITNEGGISKIIQETNPELYLSLSYIPKWGQDEKSIETGLKLIEKMLYKLDGYEQAEIEKDRDAQVDIINKLIINKPRLQRYFFENGLKGLMNQLVDPEGKMGLKKINSPKALLEFYSDKKRLAWFDRSKETYVQKWRIQEKVMWIKGEESANLGIEAIEDMLYELKGYEQAEIEKDRDAQVDIINKLIINESSLQRYFYGNGLRELMTYLIDPEGKMGLKKPKSSKALLEFYSNRKGLNWFDRSKKTYVQGWRIQEKGMWGKGEESANLGIEAIEDVLYKLDGYKDAEKEGRDAQLNIINKLITNESSLQRYFGAKGLGGLMSQLVDPEGKMGLTKRNSPKALLEFYSNRKGLNWFDRSQSVYLTANKQGRLGVAYSEVAHSEVAHSEVAYRKIA